MKNLKSIRDQFDTKYIEIRNSNIKGAGLGAFAKKNIKSGTKLGEYIGERINYDNIDQYDVDALSKSQYRMTVGSKPNITIIDAREEFIEKTNWTRFVNSVLSIDSENLNVFSYQYNQKIYFKTLKDIKKGEELLIYYGNDFWSKDKTSDSTK
tara:strand:+ start:3682 stop:4140 length:459 start_codon:yes stop_codon:yes gene_type:complete